MDTIRQVLREHTPKVVEDSGRFRAHASVLIPLMLVNGSCEVLFTKRTASVEHHKGQISFPGGRVEGDDKSWEETALRETEEEIGLPRDKIEILGRINDAVTVVSNFIIHPYVGLVPPEHDFVLNPHEVDSILKVPLRLFFTNLHDQYPVEFEGGFYKTPALVYEGEIIWGATARIMKDFIGMLKGKLVLPEIEK